MKIALLTIGGVDRSGNERVIPCLLWLIEHLTRAGHELHIFVPAQEPEPGTWQLLGATVHNAGRVSWRTRTLSAILREHTARPFDVIHAFWSGMGAVGAVAKYALRIPMLLTLPGGDVVSLPEMGYGGMLTRWGRLQLRLAAAAADRVTVPSHFMRDLAGSQGISADWIPLGVDLKQWPPTPPRHRDSSSPLRLVHVASLNRVKDQATLLHAADLLRSSGAPYELRIVGVDTLRGEVARMIAQLDLGNHVSLLGASKQDDLRQHYQWADMLVMSSRHEAGPLVMLEAALTGIPTVGTCVGHIADLSPRGALAVPIGDAHALANAISVLAGDDRLRRQVAETAQDFAAQYDAAFTAAAFTELYRRAAN